MRCRPSMRMSLTVKLLAPVWAGVAGSGTADCGLGAKAACGSTACWDHAGAARPEARAMASRRRVGSRVIEYVRGSCDEAARSGRRSTVFYSRQGLAHELQNIVVERQTHQSRKHREADILPCGHRTVA